MIYESEQWALKKVVANEIEALEIWFSRRFLRASGTDKRTNEIILVNFRLPANLQQT